MALLKAKDPHLDDPPHIEAAGRHPGDRVAMGLKHGPITNIEICCTQNRFRAFWTDKPTRHTEEIFEVSNGIHLEQTTHQDGCPLRAVHCHTIGLPIALTR